MAVRKGWLIFFIVLGVFVFMSGLFVLGLSALLDTKPVVRDDTVLRVDLAGLITERFARDAFGREIEGARVQMHDLRKALKMAAKDDRIEGVYLRVSNPELGWAKAQEIRQLLHDFKASGKFVVAFIETCDELAYYVALAADELYLQPHSTVEFNGFAAEVPFFKRLFNKVGLRPQVYNIGKYKSAGDVLKRDSMSPAHREVTEGLLASHFEEFVRTVCERRGLVRQEFEQLLDEGIYLADDALKHQLVDTLQYESDVFERLKEKVYGEEATNSRARKLRTIRLDRYARVPAKEVGLGDGEMIALIYAIGGIVSGEGGFSPLLGRSMGAESMTRMLRAARDNRSVKAVVLRVDSPGGSALASDVMWAEIEKLKEKKPVVVSMSDVAASGGYWISMNCDAIVAQPLTLTGSIGVVSGVFDASRTYDKLGIVWETVKKGKHADMPTDKRPLTQEEWEKFKEQTFAIYKTFVQKVADGRGKSWEEVDRIAQGRVWTGQEARAIGLVDSLGGLDAALALAKAEAGLDPETRTQWVVYPRPKGLLESLLERLGGQAALRLAPLAGEASWLRNLSRDTRQALRNLAALASVRRGEALALAWHVPIIR